MFGASQCMRTWHPCLWLGEWTWGSLCRRPFAGVCQHLGCVPCALGLLLHGSSVSECVVMLSSCIGRIFPFPSIRREVSVTCGTPDTGRYKQTPCKGENRDMKMCRRGGVCLRFWDYRSHPPTPPLPLQRDVWSELTLCLHFLAVVSGSHRPGGSNYEPCWFRRLAAEVEVSTDVGSREGCGESLSHLSPIISGGIAGHGGCVWV